MKFSFERAKAEGSTNKAKKAVFDNISRIDTPDAHTVILVLNNADGNFLFRMGENTAVILDPKSAATTATKPVGTGPFKFDDWKKGSSITLVKNDGYRDAAAVKMKKVTFRFINDPARERSFRQRRRAAEHVERRTSEVPEARQIRARFAAEGARPVLDLIKGRRARGTR